MNRLTGLDGELYFASHGPQLEPLLRRVDGLLLDDQLPRVWAVAQYREPAQLVKGHHTIDSARQHGLLFDGHDLSDAGAEQLDERTRQTADVMVKATADLMTARRALDPDTVLLGQTRFRYDYATWTQASLRVAGGILAIVSKTKLEKRDEILDNANYQIIIDDNTARLDLGVAVAGAPFDVTFRVETSQDLLQRAWVKLVGFDKAQELLNGEGNNFDMKTPLFLAERIARKRDTPDLRVIARQGLRRAVAVRRIRQEFVDPEYADLPNGQALDTLYLLLNNEL